MWIYESLAGAFRVELVSADIPLLLETLNGEGVLFRDLKVIDLLTVHATVSRGQYKLARRVVTRKGGICRPLEQKGLYWSLKHIVKRPVFAAGIVLLLFLAAYLPTKVLFVRVEGNRDIPSRQILEQAGLCGIRFGASRQAVRSETVKNSLLTALPQLQWAGINTYGCTAVISVRERAEAAEREPVYTVSSIIAARDGIVDSVTVTRGNGLCRTGQAVKRGQVLISGYTDCGISIQATQAEGEVFAQTFRSMEVLFPLDWLKKTEPGHAEKKFSLLIGKKRINFSKDSGISYTSCDKMYSEYYVTLPGGFRLPVAVIVESYIPWEPNAASYPADQAKAEAEDRAAEYIAQQMISGAILDSRINCEQDGQVLALHGNYVCREMIGRVQNEEIIESYGKDHGKDR